MKLTVGCGAYDRTWPLAASVVQPEGFELDWTVLPPEEVFLRGMLGRRIPRHRDVALSTYLLLRSRGRIAIRGCRCSYRANFATARSTCAADSGIEGRRHLVGRRVGVPEYQLTANVWVRGILADEYGVRPKISIG